MIRSHRASGESQPVSPEHERIEVCNDQLSGAMRELRNAIQRVEDIRDFTQTELESIDKTSLIDNPAFARANELLFESELMIQAFVED